MTTNTATGAKRVSIGGGGVRRPSGDVGNGLLRSGRSNEHVEQARNSGYNMHGSTSGE
jgi:hypothetical protein